MGVQKKSELNGDPHGNAQAQCFYRLRRGVASRKEANGTLDLSWATGLSKGWGISSRRFGQSNNYKGSKYYCIWAFQPRTTGAEALKLKFELLPDPGWRCLLFHQQGSRGRVKWGSTFLPPHGHLDAGPRPCFARNLADVMHVCLGVFVLRLFDEMMRGMPISSVAPRGSFCARMLSTVRVWHVLGGMVVGPGAMTDCTCRAGPGAG